MKSLPKCGVFSMMMRILSLALVLANLTEAQRSGCNDVQCLDEQASLDNDVSKGCGVWRCRKVRD